MSYSQHKKKIIIASSRGGGGHISAAQAITAYLEEIDEAYEINTINLIDEALACVDPFRFFTLGRKNSEDFYNYCLQKNWPGLINAIYKINNFTLQYTEKFFEKCIERYLKQTPLPDMIISVVPLINGCLSRIAERHNIPLLIVPTDLNASLFLYGLKPPYNDQLHFNICYQDTDVLNKVVPASFDEQNISVNGFVIRPDFYRPKNTEDIKRTFNVPQGKPVVLLLMGAAGSDKMRLFMGALQKFSFPLHVIVCLGRHESLRPEVEAFTFPSFITKTVLGTTPAISDLMAISDCCIIKPGSVSVSEALYMNLPMILDNIGTSLLWERFNLNFVKKHQFGAVLESISQLHELVYYFACNKVHNRQIRNQISMFEKKECGPAIKKLVHSMTEGQTLCPDASLEKNYNYEEQA